MIPERPAHDARGAWRPRWAAGLALAGWAALLLAGCTQPRPDSSGHPKPASVGVAVEIKLSNRPRRPQVVMFAQLDEEGRLDRVRELIPASRMEGDRAYLLDVPRGRYVAVAVVYDPESLGSDAAPFEPALGMFGDTIFLPQGAIRLSEIEATSTEMNFMGRFVVETEPFRLERAGPAQAHFSQVAESEYGAELDADSAALARLMASFQDERAEQAFLEAARGDLLGTGWLPVIKLRLDELEQGAEGEPTEP